MKLETGNSKLESRARKILLAKDAEGLRAVLSWAVLEDIPVLREALAIERHSLFPRPEVVYALRAKIERLEAGR